MIQLIYVVYVLSIKKNTKSKLISFAVLPSSSRNPNNCYDKKYDCSYLTLTKYANCSISC